MADDPIDMFGKPEPVTRWWNGTPLPMCSAKCHRYIPKDGKWQRSHCRGGQSSPNLCMPRLYEIAREHGEMKLELVELRARLGSDQGESAKEEEIER